MKKNRLAQTEQIMNAQWIQPIHICAQFMVLDTTQRQISQSVTGSSFHRSQCVNLCQHGTVAKTKEKCFCVRTTVRDKFSILITMILIQLQQQRRALFLHFARSKLRLCSFFILLDARTSVSKNFAESGSKMVLVTSVAGMLLRVFSAGSLSFGMILAHHVCSAYMCLDVVYFFLKLHVQYIFL